MTLFAQVMDFLTTGVSAVFGWFTDILNSIFGSYVVFGFIIVGAMVFIWALKTLAVFNPGSDSAIFSRRQSTPTYHAASTYMDHASMNYWKYGS